MSFITVISLQYMKTAHSCAIALVTFSSVTHLMFAYIAVAASDRSARPKGGTGALLCVQLLCNTWYCSSSVPRLREKLQFDPQMYATVFLYSARK